MFGDLARRCLDVTLALIGVALVFPILLVISGLIKADSPGPVLFRAQRVGKNGRLFRLYKFRSMETDAHRDGPAITADRDHRITQVGRLLRTTKLDELPQLLNVLRGEMSLVGPRPEDPRYVALYTPAQRAVLQVRPGITGAASLAYRNESALLTGEDWEQLYVGTILPQKLSIEMEYLANRTLASDLGVLIRTVLTIVRQQG